MGSGSAVAGGCTGSQEVYPSCSGSPRACEDWRQFGRIEAGGTEHGLDRVHPSGGDIGAGGTANSLFVPTQSISRPF
jgi:hypothetical protein